MSSRKSGDVAWKEPKNRLSAVGLDVPANDAMAEAVRRTAARTRDWLLRHQRPDGHWVAELEGDSLLQSETILLLAFEGREGSELARRAARRLVETQLPDGGWSMYPGGAVEVSNSVKAYFALKLTGHDPDADTMQRARRAIRACGGADAVNSFTRFYLALLGQISYDQCPEVPPELVLLPRWFPVNLYALSSWSRTIIVPLSIVSALRPRREIEPARGIGELFLKEPKDWPPLRSPGASANPALLSWDRFFRAVDRLLHRCRRWGLLPWRRRAIEEATRWMLERFESSDGPGAIYPPIGWSMVALEALGYAEDSPEVDYCRKQLEALAIDDPATDTVRLQPCKSPVWDTALTLRALHSTGTSGENAAVTAAVDWLLDREITRRGDWAETVDAAPGGWCFEYANDFYPDNDDTAMVLMALAEQFPSLRTVDRLDRTTAAINRGLAWMRAMQNDDGGWGAFDRNNNRRFLCHVPFADHNAMIDPSTPDLTARVVEALAALGATSADPAVARAIDYLRRTQEPDGSWFGRWGVNYIYGTWQTLTGLIAAGTPTDDPAVVAGANWLIEHQQPSGGWGESADSYADPSLRGRGPVTASQTAWALLGLLAAGKQDHPAVRRGVRFLVDTQQDDGAWDEPEFTGTGFPQVFYLRYHYYRIYFPLLALSRWNHSHQARELRPPGWDEG